MPFAVSRSTDSDGPDCVFQLHTITIGLQNIEEPHPSDSSTAVITLVIFHTLIICSALYLHCTAGPKAMSLKLVEANSLMQQAITATQSGKKTSGLEEQRRKRKLEVERQE